MSSSDDDEWEREQMLRGCQSRQKYSKRATPQSTHTAGSKKTQSNSPKAIDVNFAKEHLSKEIERLTGKLEEMKRSIGGLKREVAERENRKNSIRKLIGQLEGEKVAATLPKTSIEDNGIGQPS